jgi:hypothetical protein
MNAAQRGEGVEFHDESADMVSGLVEGLIQVRDRIRTIHAGVLFHNELKKLADETASRGL